VLPLGVKRGAALPVTPGRQVGRRRVGPWRRGRVLARGEAGRGRLALTAPAGRTLGHVMNFNRRLLFFYKFQ